MLSRKDHGSIKYEPYLSVAGPLVDSSAIRTRRNRGPEDKASSE